MNRRIVIYIASFLFCMLFFSQQSSAQFNERGPFSQTYNEPGDTTSVSDSTEKLFSFKELFRGLAHKDTIKIGTMFAGSVFLPGAAQIYNKDCLWRNRSSGRYRRILSPQIQSLKKTV